MAYRCEVSPAEITLGALAVYQYVNADPIAQGLSYLRPETMGMATGRVMLTRLRALAGARESFAFETTLASRSSPWLSTLRASGYRAHLTFLSLPSPDLAVARVAERVREGGHGIPGDNSPATLCGWPAQLLFSIQAKC